MEEQAVALDLHLDLAEELAQLAESVGNMPESTFHVVHAAPTPSRDNLVVDIFFPCDAPVEPADQDRMRRGRHTRLRLDRYLFITIRVPRWGYAPALTTSTIVTPVQLSHRQAAHSSSSSRLQQQPAAAQQPSRHPNQQADRQLTDRRISVAKAPASR
jgi:hypothetical protein